MNLLDINTFYNLFHIRNCIKYTSNYAKITTRKKLSKIKKILKTQFIGFGQYQKIIKIKDRIFYISDNLVLQFDSNNDHPLISKMYFEYF